MQTFLSRISPAAQEYCFNITSALSLGDWQVLWYMMTAAAVIMLASACLARWLKMVNWYELHTQGPAETSIKRLQQSADKIVSEGMLHWGKVVYVGRHDVAAQIFRSSAFISRLGSDHGLKLLRMYEQGVIWNNNTADWQVKRQYFAKGVQELVVQRSTCTKQITIAAYKQTLAEHCHEAAQAAYKAATGSEPEMIPSMHMPATLLPSVAELAMMPLCDLASAVAGINLDLPGGRDFFRLVAFRVIVALTLGLPVNALNMKEALTVVHQVAAFFKAWEYFLLRPGWLCYLTSFTKVHKQHISAITSLQHTTASLVNRAKDTAHPDLAGCFLGRLLADHAAGKLSQQSVEQLTLEMLLAGTDTSSISLYYLMVALADDPNLEQQLTMEVLNAAGSISQLCDSSLAAQLPISYGYDSDLPKCQAALCEAMRYKPVGPVSIRQAVHPVTLQYHSSASDADLNKSAPTVLQLQPGDTVIVSLAAMHRDPTVFTAPEDFKPFENFPDVASDVEPGALFTASAVNGETAAVAADCTKSGKAPANVSPTTMPSAAVTGDRASDVFRPFGHGRKGCVGRELGWLEMKVMLACWLLTMRFKDSKTTAEGGSTTFRADFNNSICTTQAAADIIMADNSPAGCTGSSTLDSPLVRSTGTGSSVVVKAAVDSCSKITQRSGRSTKGIAVTLSQSNSHQGCDSKLSKIITKWEVASQPINPEPLYARCVAVAGPSRVLGKTSPSRIYLVGPHSAGKTTLCNALLQEVMPGGIDDDISLRGASAECPIGHAASNSKIPEPSTVTAAAAATLLGWCGGDAVETNADSEIQAESSSCSTESRTGSDTSRFGNKYAFITETARSVMEQHNITRAQLVSQGTCDTCTTADNTNGIAQSSTSVFLLLQQLIVKEQLRRESRLIAGGCSYMSDRAVIDPLAYTAERFGTQSPQVHKLLSDLGTQELLQSCRQPSSIVLLIPPFSHEGITAPVDDGVRLTTPTSNLTNMYKQLMQQLQVPYELVQSSTVADRVQEVLFLLGCNSKNGMR